MFLGLGQMALRWVKRTFFDGTNLAQNSFDSRDASFWTRFRHGPDSVSGKLIQKQDLVDKNILRISGRDTDRYYLTTE